MKLLLFYTKRFYFKTASKGLPGVADLDREDDVDNAVVIFFHVECNTFDFFHDFKWLINWFNIFLYPSI